jgi:hypothetical protein
MGCRICAALGVEDADLVEDERMILSPDLAATHLVSFLPLVQHLRYRVLYFSSNSGCWLGYSDFNNLLFLQQWHMLARMQ